LLKILNLKLSWWSSDPTEYLYSGPLLIRLGGSRIEDSIENVVDHLNNDYRKLDSYWKELNVVVNDIYGISCSDSGLIEDFCLGKPKDFLRNWYGYDDEIEEVLLYELISHFVGESFGILNPSVEDLFVDQPFDDFFTALPQPRPCISESYVKNTVPNMFFEGEGGRDLMSEAVLSRVAQLGGDFEGGFDKQLFDVFGKTLSELLVDPKCFFDFHFRQFTRGKKKAPIYLPLQLMKAEYTIWISYYDLDNGALLACVNDFIDPDLKRIYEEMTRLKALSDRTRTEEDSLEFFSESAADLEGFKDEILRICKFWKPKYIDGVKIQLAPLWRLFQHSGWRSQLQGTWQDLESGVLDWSQTAIDFWPERVLKKCHLDQSIALAHGVEFDLWEEVKIKVGKSKKEKLVWQPKEMTEVELDEYIKNKIAKG